MRISRKGSCRPRVVTRWAPSGRRAAGWCVAPLAGGVALLSAAGAAAAEPVRTFNIPTERLDEALVAFGRQAGVTVGLRDPGRCGAVAQAVSGAYTPSAALARLLAGTRCGFVALDASAFTVEPRGPARPEPRKAPPRAATPNPPAEGDLLLDLTVTTTRRPSLIGRTPASVGMVAQDVLSTAHIEGLMELAPEFAGLTVTNLGPGRDKVLVRGLSDGAFTGRTQSTVGLYVDDLPVTYNSPDPDLRLVDIQRVELMRGPQGPLYGVGSMGGIVRMVTNKPDLSAPAAGFAAGVAATDGGAASYSADVMLNAPVVRDRLGVRVVGYDEVEGGYIDNPALGLKNTNRTRRTGGRLIVSGLVTPDWRVSLGGIRQSLRSDDSQYIEGGDGLSRNGLVREPHDSDFTQAYVTVEGPTPLGQLRLTGALLDHAFDDRSDASNGLALFVSTSTVGTFDQDYRIRLAMAEAVLTSPPGGRLQWLAGVFASRTRETMVLDISELTGLLRNNLYVEDRHDRLGEVAAFGEVSYALAPRLTFTAGLRAFNTWLRTDSERHQQAIPLDFSGSMRSAKISPMAVLSWQASPSKLFYVQAGQGYRTGGFNTTGRINQQFNAPATGNQPNRQYRPDTVWSFEAGAKLAFEERRFELRTALFYTDWRDVQSDQFLTSGLPYTANVGRAVNTGFEGEGAYRVDRALSLRANLLLAGPQLIERDPTYPSRPNASLPAVPRYSASLIADWRREVGLGLTGVLYGRLAYVGPSIVTFQEQPSSEMGNYVTARLSAGLETSGWRLTAYIDNPANTRGETFAFGDPFTQGRVRQSTPLRPRTAGLTFARGL